jgi:hypothetical protein
VFPPDARLGVILRPTKDEEDAENQNHRSLTLAARNEAPRYRGGTVREPVRLFFNHGPISSTERSDRFRGSAPSRSRFGKTLRYFIGEKSAGSRYTDSTFCTILPSFSDSFATWINSGSFRNSAQFFSAASRLGCASK